jgi:methylated-DNA-[protein]-cysteine S-methyltransferase
VILDALTLDGPVGPLRLLARGGALLACEFADTGGGTRLEATLARLARHLGPFEVRHDPDPAGAATRLARYFGGARSALEDQPVELLGTPFQRQVWTALRAIPVGQAWSYGQLAAHLGRPRAQRAVGAANGANPVALFVPCHRVLAADRTLWGYGGGLERKGWLLAHEGASFTDEAAQGPWAGRRPPRSLRADGVTTDSRGAPGTPATIASASRWPGRTPSPPGATLQRSPRSPSASGRSPRSRRRPTSVGASGPRRPSAPPSEGSTSSPG